MEMMIMMITDLDNDCDGYDNDGLDYDGDDINKSNDNDRLKLLVMVILLIIVVHNDCDLNSWNFQVVGIQGKHLSQDKTVTQSDEYAEPYEER